MIEVKNLNKSFGSNLVLKDINLSVEKGEVIALIGSSGSGKSTLLRCLNLLEKADHGSIIYHKKNLLSNKINIEKMRQSMGMVFQSFNLFENLNVIDNCTIACRLTKNEKKDKAEKRAIKYLKQVNMLDYAKASSTTLSGGQKQRVAIARALCMNPDLLLFDEPTSALDPESVQDVLDVIKDLAEQGMSMIIVTHEILFAKDVADRILFMADGVIVEDIKPENIFKEHSDDRVNTFLKRYNSF
ncbi:MAG: amino acid ABC transporter ATP-binding protein [Bacilli bacterium]|nr:amino acid ABC transporter ATP-binding protein [Bacilli bacterium]